MTSKRQDDSAFRDPLADSMGDEGTPHFMRESASENDVVDLTADSDDEPKMRPNPQSSNIIDLDEEDEDEDLRRAIALSVQDMNDSKAREEVVHDETLHKGRIGSADSDKSGHTLSTEDSQPNNTAPPTAFSILGLDRKKLEEERLARVAKRKAETSISPPPLRRAAKVIRRDASPTGGGFTRPKAPSSPRLSRTPAKTADTDTPVIVDTKTKPPTTVQPSSVPPLKFPKGAVKKTWAFGYSRDGDDIKLEEVLQSADLELAILSAFQWDMEWLFTKFRTRDTRFMLVMQAKDESTKLQYEEETANMPNIRLCFPPMDGQVNCMHSKLMLLFHPNYLRIVVPSANLVPYDWGELGGVMENTVFLIDLPKASDDATVNLPKTAFHEDLVYFLQASTLHSSLISKLSKFDFKETSRYAFVHTIGGSHIGESLRRTGHCGLGRAVRSLGLRTQKPISIDFVTSSIGSLTEEFMRSIYLSAQGDDGTIEYALRTSKAFPVTAGPDHCFVQSTTGAEWKKHFRVYYPSEHTVSQSKGGYRSAGTICFQEKWFEGAKFPKHVLHDCVSRRDGLLMHNKMLFARPADTNTITRPDGSNCAGWAGRIVHDRTRKEPKLNCRNWECGVLVPIVLGDGGESESSSSSASAAVAALSNGGSKEKEEKDMTGVFGTTVPVPMHVPAPPLAATLKPWYGAW